MQRTYFMCKFFNQHVRFIFVLYPVGLAHVHSHQTMWIKCSWLLCTDFDSFGKSTNETRNSKENGSDFYMLASTLQLLFGCCYCGSFFLFSLCACMALFFAFIDILLVLNENCRHCVTAEAAKACILHFAFVLSSLSFSPCFLFLFLFFFSVWFAKHFIRFQLHQCSVLKYSAIIWLYDYACAVRSCCLCTSWIAFAHMYIQ